MPKILRIIAVFFTLALLCAQVAVQASTNPSSTMVFTELANAPPGQTVIAIVMTENFQIIDQATVCQQIARGVSVPYLGLINNDCIVFEDFTNYQCNIYYTISRIDLKLETLTGFKNKIDKYPFSGDLGLRWAPSVIV